MINDLMNNANISLHIPPLMWQSFCAAMKQAQTTGEEVIGFFFCKRHTVSKREIRYLPQKWVVPSPECYEYQSESGLILKQKFHHYLLKNFLEIEQWEVVHIHTHTDSGTPQFSTVDDHYEAEYARFLASTFKHKPRLISGIFDQSFQYSQFRIWSRSGRTFQNLTFYSGWWEKSASFSVTTVDPMFARQTFFGETFQNRLGQLSVTLIGCGGIGATFTEQLGRLGVKKWVLVDPDRVETSNLNRMPGATPKMADQQWYKVHYLKHSIKRIYATGSSVFTFPTSIEDSSIETQIAATDLIVVATDNHHSRQIAQELALKYLRPLISLGTHIEVICDGKPQMYARVTIPPLGGGWCLMCGNMISLQRAALECAPNEICQLAAEKGYLDDIHDPAVFWLNSMCASAAVGIIQGWVSGFLNLDAGLDWIYQFPIGDWMQTNVNHLRNTDCLFCASR